MGWKETKPSPFREVIVSYLVPALHPLIQRNNDIQPAVSISPLPPSLSLSLLMHRCVAAALRQKVSSSPLEGTSSSVGRSVGRERASERASPSTRRFSSGKISFLPRPGTNALSSLV